MRPARTNDNGDTLSLVYTDSWGDQQYILEMEGLCQRAGCICLQGLVRCVNFSDIFFEHAIYIAFSHLCVTRCSCAAIDERKIFDHKDDRLTANGPQNLAVGNYHLIHEAGRPPNAVTRNNPTGSASGGATCLRGEAAGWTLWVWRMAKCCSDTTFEALTAQEAYALFGVAPFASDIITNHVTIGICLQGHRSRLK